MSSPTLGCRSFATGAFYMSESLTFASVISSDEGMAEAFLLILTT